MLSRCIGYGFSNKKGVLFWKRVLVTLPGCNRAMSHPQCIQFYSIIQIPEYISSNVTTNDFTGFIQRHHLFIFVFQEQVHLVESAAKCYALLVRAIERSFNEMIPKSSSLVLLGNLPAECYIYYQNDFPRRIVFNLNQRI